MPDVYQVEHNQQTISMRAFADGTEIILEYSIRYGDAESLTVTVRGKATNPIDILCWMPSIDSAAFGACVAIKAALQGMREVAGAYSKAKRENPGAGVLEIIEKAVNIIIDRSPDLKIEAMAILAECAATGFFGGLGDP